MAETVSQVVTDILTEGSFDADNTQALRWLNRRHRELVGYARSYRKSSVIAGGTVASQQAYAAPSDLVEAREVTVDGVTYGKARHTDISAGALDRLWLSGDGGVFIETASSAGVDQIGLFPIPTTSSLVISVYGAYYPPALLIDNSVPFQVDDEFLEGLIAGVFATALARPGEGREDLAGPQEARFQAAKEAARRRENKRLRGPGPAQIRLA